MIVLMHVHKVNQLHPRPASQGGLPRRRTARKKEAQYQGDAESIAFAVPKSCGDSGGNARGSLLFLPTKSQLCDCGSWERAACVNASAFC
jgi:hypothetical protein